MAGYEDPNKDKRASSATVIDEILVGTLLLPLAKVSPRAQLSNLIFVTDASDKGWSAAEASAFCPSSDKLVQQHATEENIVLNEVAGCLKDPPVQVQCSICLQPCLIFVSTGQFANFPVCSWDCFRVHRLRPCLRVADVCAG